VSSFLRKNGGEEVWEWKRGKSARTNRKETVETGKRGQWGRVEIMIPRKEEGWKRGDWEKGRRRKEKEGKWGGGRKGRRGKGREGKGKKVKRRG
jgi:hypothetical protein